jgi:Trypsin-co-occurring domain 1
MDTRHFTDDNRPIHVEITAKPAEQGGLQETTRGGRVQEVVKQISDDALFEAFHTIYQVARKTEMLVNDLHDADNPQPLSGAEIEFGIKFNVGLEAVITAGAEATITVKLTWGKP